MHTTRTSTRPRHWHPYWHPYLLAACLLAVLAGCSSGPVTGPVASGGPPSDRVPAARLELVRLAARQIGTPYRYGGSDRSGFDCSGLVQYVHGQLGVAVPRTTASQWAQARVSARPHLLPGDLLFFSLGARKERHVAIYEGGGRFIHAPSSGKPVGRASLANPYWQAHLIGSRTFL